MGEAKRRAAVPPLRDWLATMIPSENAAARDAYAEFADWTARMLDMAQPADPVQGRLLRMTQAASLAIVEICNHEQRAGTDGPTTACDMCRALGISFGYALMSLGWDDDAPVRSFATPFAEEFKRGLKVAIDLCLAHADDPEGARGG